MIFSTNNYYSGVLWCSLWYLIECFTLAECRALIRVADHALPHLPISCYLQQPSSGISSTCRFHYPILVLFSPFSFRFFSRYSSRQTHILQLFSSHHLFQNVLFLIFISSSLSTCILCRTSSYLYVSVPDIFNRFNEYLNANLVNDEVIIWCHLRY